MDRDQIMMEYHTILKKKKHKTKKNVTYAFLFRHIKSH